MPKRLLDVALKDIAHLGELRKDQRAVVFFQRLFEHLRDARQFPAAAVERRVVLQELRRMIAHLLQLHQRGQHQSLTLDAFGRFDGRLRVLYHGFVKRSLLFGEIAEDLHLQFVGQVGDDALVGLQPPQDERRRDATQPV